MASLLNDLRFAVRTLRRFPLFTSVAVLSLALGIGANTAIFTLIDQLMLRLLPVKDPEQLVMIWSTGPHLGNNRGRRAASYPMYQDFQQKAQAFSYVFCRYTTPLSITFDGRTERVAGELVSGNYFQALGVTPAAGRVFSSEDDDRVYKGHPVVVLSHHYWTTRFNADPKVIGAKILVNNYPMTIVGVSAAGFNGLDPSVSPQVRVPIQMKPLVTPGSDQLADRRSQWIQMFARMKPGYTVSSAQASLQPLFHQILQYELTLPSLKDISAYHRDLFLKRVVRMEAAASGYSEMRNQVSAALIVLMCMVGLVLLIACSNVANLLIARAVARQKEIAVRLAIGAARGRLIRQLLVESVLLSALGGVVGLVLSYWIIRGLLAFVPMEGAALVLQASPDWRVMSFTFAVSVLTGLLFGLAPALQSLRIDLWSTLKDVAGAVAGQSGPVRLRKGLVVAQITLSFLLLAGAGLFVKSLSNLKNTQSGFREIDNLITFQLDPSLNGYQVQQTRQFYDELRRRLASLPGVKSVAYATVPLLHGYEWDSTMSVDGYRARDGEDMQAFMNALSPGYFSTMGIPFLEGRDFDARDSGETIRTAIVNRKFAEHFFGNRSALGRRIGFGGGPNVRLEIEIVGVVENSLYEGPREGVHRQVFVPGNQGRFLRSAAFYVRTGRQSSALAPLLRREVAKLDSALPVYEMKTLETQLDETLAAERLIAVLSSAFGALATLLAAIGLYGVMAFVVSRRTKEIGLRMALGAGQAAVLWMVMRDVLLLLGIGLAIGVPCAYAAGRYVSAQLFGVQSTDLWTAAAALAVLSAIAIAAGFLPAHRASRIDPIRALRYE